MGLVLHLYSCVTTSKTLLRQVMWTDHLRSMQSAIAELSMDDMAQEMLVVGMERVQAYWEAHRLKF